MPPTQFTALKFSDKGNGRYKIMNYSHLSYDLPKTDEKQAEFPGNHFVTVKLSMPYTSHCVKYSRNDQSYRRLSYLPTRFCNSRIAVIAPYVALATFE